MDQPVSNRFPRMLLGSKNSRGVLATYAFWTGLASTVITLTLVCVVALR
jgi:hypothetical protein